MQLELLPYRSSDYERVNQLYRDHGWRGVPAAILPETGVIACRDRDIVAASFLWLARTGACAMAGMTVVAVRLTPRERIAAADAVLAAVVRMAQAEIGKEGVLLAYAANPAMQRIYERHGFTAGETGMTNFHRAFGPVDCDFLTEDA